MSSVPTTSPDRSQTWNPDLYRSVAAFVHRNAEDLVDVLAPRPGERVLDLGCGTGELTAAIAARGATVLGVDFSAAMIEKARRDAPTLSFAVADGQALPYEGEFDAVFSNAALHWMAGAEAVARGMHRALRPGGRLVAEFGGHGCIATVTGAVERTLRAWGEDPSVLWPRWYFPDLATYVALLAGAGFSVRFAHLFDRPTPLEGDDGLANWIRLFATPLVERLGDRWAAFAREVEEQCAPTLRTNGGRASSEKREPWVLDYVRLRVVAIKRAAG